MRWLNYEINIIKATDLALDASREEREDFIGKLSDQVEDRLEGISEGASISLIEVEDGEPVDPVDYQLLFYEAFHALKKTAEDDARQTVNEIQRKLDRRKTNG